MTRQQANVIRDIKARLETRDSYDAAVREGRAAIEAEILALSAEYKALKAQGDDDAAAAVKARAAVLYAQL